MVCCSSEPPRGHLQMRHAGTLAEHHRSLLAGQWMVLGRRTPGHGRAVRDRHVRRHFRYPLAGKLQTGFAALAENTRGNWLNWRVSGRKARARSPLPCSTRSSLPLARIKGSARALASRISTASMLLTTRRLTNLPKGRARASSSQPLAAQTSQPLVAQAS